MTIITHKGKVRNGAVTPMFISKWDTTQAGSANDTIVLPLVSDGDYDFYVNWGDGSVDNITGYNQSEVTHQYENTGIYTIKIFGDISGWQFNNAGDDDKIIEISKWGPLRFVSNDNNLFFGCSNLDVTANDSLTLDTSNGAFMFYSCPNIGSEGDMNSWDTSSVMDMFYMFGYSPSFNQPIGDWDTSSVTNMLGMFEEATAFNQPIGSWDVGNVLSMDSMFNGATVFNQPLSGWNTSNVTNMSSMFDTARDFNQDIGSWDVSNVTNMTKMFQTVFFIPSSFNNGGSPSISGWDTSNVTNMQQMFQYVDAFNQPIGTWDTSSVTNISSMFLDADSFDQDLSNWVVTGVTNANSFMADANGLSTTNYDRTLSGWSSQAVQSGVNIHFGNSQYSTATGLAYRNALVASGWTITDGGAV